MNSYDDVRIGLESGIDSWTTIDLNTKYSFTNSVFDDLSLALSVTNLLDEDPPFVADPIFNINIDGANASLLGRFVALQLNVKW